MYIKITDVNKTIKKAPILRDINLEFTGGKVYGLRGKNGSGKTMLMRAICGLITPDSGIIDINGKILGKDISFPESIGVLIENPAFIGNYTGFKNLKVLASIQNRIGDEQIRKALEDIGLDPDDKRTYRKYSLGMKQRLAIARALLLDPAFIVADEPVSALDVSVQAQILNLLMDLRETFSLTMLFISHEMTVVRHLCDQVAVMYLGTVVEQADSEELFRNLLHPYTQSLMSAIPTLDPDHKKQRIVLQGDIPSAIDLPKGCPFADRCPQCQAQCKESRPPLRDVGGGHLVACHLV